MIFFFFIFFLQFFIFFKKFNEQKLTDVLFHLQWNSTNNLKCTTYAVVPIDINQ